MKKRENDKRKTRENVDEAGKKFMSERDRRGGKNKYV